MVLLCMVNMFMFRGFIWFIGPSNSEASVNLALKRPSTQSSVFRNLTPDLAVDGKYDLDTTELSCAVTATYARNAWWQVQLDQLSLISHIHLVFEDRDTILSNKILYVSKSADIQSGKRCYSENRTNPNLIKQVFCQVEGRFVTYHMHSSINSATLLLCEVEVYGCPVGFYGPQCTSRCSKKCLNQYCEPNFGYCIEGCTSGFYGDRCRKGYHVHTTDYSTKYLVAIVILVVIALFLTAVIVTLLYFRKKERNKESRPTKLKKCQYENTTIEKSFKPERVHADGLGVDINYVNQTPVGNTLSAMVYKYPVIQTRDENVLFVEDYTIPREQGANENAFPEEYAIPYEQGTSFPIREYEVPVSHSACRESNKSSSLNGTRGYSPYYNREVHSPTSKEKDEDPKRKIFTHKGKKSHSRTNSKHKPPEKSVAPTYEDLQDPRPKHVYDSLNQQ